MNIRVFGPIDRALLLLSVICGFLYPLTLAFQPFPGRVLLKVLSIVALAALGYRGPAPSSVNLGVALTLSSLGDALLELDFRHLFIWGLQSFLMAHASYILLFVRNRVRSTKPKAWQVALVAGVSIYSLLLTLWLEHRLGSLKFPVIIYVCVITLMVASAILAGFSNYWVSFGAILFLISDSILAINLFKSPVPKAGYLVWATYFLAQFGIAVGFLLEKKSDGNAAILA